VATGWSEEADVERVRLGLGAVAAQVEEVGRTVGIAVDLVVRPEDREPGDRIDVVGVDRRPVEVGEAVDTPEWRMNWLISSCAT